MNDSIFALIGSLFGTLCGIFTTSKLVAFRLKQLENKVEKHNNLIERMQAVEDRAKSNTHRLNNIEGKVDLFNRM